MHISSNDQEVFALELQEGHKLPRLAALIPKVVAGVFVWRRAGLWRRLTFAWIPKLGGSRHAYSLAWVQAR